MDFETELPCFVVTYKELLERRKKLLEKLSTLGSTNAGSFIAETEETHVCSGVHNLSAKGNSSNRGTERGVLQLKPTHHENWRQKSKLQVDGYHHDHKECSGGSKSKGSRLTPVRNRDTASGGNAAAVLYHKWNTKEGELQNLLSRWTGSPANVSRIFSSW